MHQCLCGRASTTTVSTTPHTNPTTRMSRITRRCTALMRGSSTTRSGPNTRARALIDSPRALFAFPRGTLVSFRRHVRAHQPGRAMRSTSPNSYSWGWRPHFASPSPANSGARLDHYLSEHLTPELSSSMAARFSNRKARSTHQRVMEPVTCVSAIVSRFFRVGSINMNVAVIVVTIPGT